jgi:hypothetical protein
LDGSFVFHGSPTLRKSEFVVRDRLEPLADRNCCSWILYSGLHVVRL